MLLEERWFWWDTMPLTVRGLLGVRLKENGYVWTARAGDAVTVGWLCLVFIFHKGPQAVTDKRAIDVSKMSRKFIRPSAKHTEYCVSREHPKRFPTLLRGNGFKVFDRTLLRILKQLDHMWYWIFFDLALRFFSTKIETKRVIQSCLSFWEHYYNISFKTYQIL